jgi:hypothetical protein
MYQGSRNMLFFLVVVFVAVRITCGVIVATVLKSVVAGKAYLLT